MRHWLKFMLALGILLAGVSSARAFSLLGEAGEWHVERLGHLDGFIGGPMNLGEEHRWNVPLIYYGYSPEFLMFFGSRGEAEIEKALSHFRNLPQMSQLNIDNYPLSVNRMNHRAARLGLLDLKSVTMHFIIEELGLGDPANYVFTLRKRYIINDTTNYIVLKRNFDPITRELSSYINGGLWTFGGILDGDDISLPNNQPVDPLFRSYPVASLSFSPGSYFSSLSRDDVGGLKYIYNKNNHNVENADTNAFAVGFGVAIGGAGGGSPWAHPVFTNSAATNNPADPNAPAGGGGNTNFVVTAVRPGIDRISFAQVYFDSVLGFFVQTNFAYSDTIILNGREFVQRLGRTVLQPDLLFHGADTWGGGTTDDGFGLIARSDAFTSNADLNGTYGVGGNNNAESTLGPGIINPGIVILFNTAGDAFSGIPGSGETFGQLFRWGSYDGTTNAPVTYPIGTSIEDIENRVTGGN